ncbi:predicted protein [Nematostella vectensis]|uniref:Uncharacterized protein n=1 Tax=Nematostella vectensis TaxID=45351 RepID=A7SF64_NEMVE|nr:predicted protein [Nematostella vectensis]|eukprot:XP_001629715.1 predicted protein [Nematostella vectensis]
MAMEEQLDEEREKRIRLDAYSLREHLSFKGIPEKEGESCENIIRDLLHELGFSNPQNIGFHAVHRLGKPRDGGKPSPIIARVISRQDRDLDFRKKRKLVGSTCYPGVYITDDFQREIQRERIILIKAMEKAKTMGKQVLGRSLHVDGNTYQVASVPEIYREVPVSRRIRRQLIKEFSKVLKRIMQENDLIDIWRVRNPDSKRYTWRQKKQLVQRRLDFWLISNFLQDVIESAKIKTAIQTDHSAILLSIDNLEFQTPGPFWKYNTSLSDDGYYVSMIKAKIEELKKDTQVIRTRAFARIGLNII